MITDRVRHLAKAFRALAVDLSTGMLRHDRADRFAVLARHARGLADELEKLSWTAAELAAGEPRGRETAQ